MKIIYYNYLLINTSLLTTLATIRTIRARSTIISYKSICDFRSRISRHCNTIN